MSTEKSVMFFSIKFDNCHVAHYIKNMTISNIHKREIPPTHPGEMLREDFMTDYHLTPTSLASNIYRSLWGSEKPNISLILCVKKTGETM